MDITNVVIWVAAGALLLLVLFLLTFLAVWVRARLAGAEVGIFDLVGMRLRGVPYSVIVDAKIAATKAGLSVDVEKIDAHYLAGGNIVQTVQALIAAQKAGLHLDWNRACAIDIATRGTNKSVLEAVLTSVSPKVIDCPNPSSGRTTIDAVAKDGIQVKVKARVTVRTNLDRFVGGAQEETIIARVEEMRARVVEAEAQIPQALAEALRSGRMGYLDFQRLENLRSDTEMRKGIAGDGPAPGAKA